MNAPIPVTGDVYWVGVNDRDTHLFEGLWPLPRGVSYNSYLITDEKTVLVDTVKNQRQPPFVDKIRRVLGDHRPIDYLVINHMEPDHSGSVKLLLEIFPQMKLVGNAKTTRFLKEFYDIDDSVVHVVDDGDVLDVGRHKLQFHITPMVHWPETMMTYDTTEKILFSGDAFGGFGALDGGIFDDEVDVAYFEDEILRYFSNIVGKYSNMVQKAIAKLAGLDIRIIAATHGPVWRSQPGTIVALYERWSRHEGENGVVLAYASMYGNSASMMESVARGIATEDVPTIRIHNVSHSHVSYMVRDAWRFKGLILGSPTYDTGLFPYMDNFIRLLQEKRLRKRILGLFGTYGWSGGGVKTLRAFAEQGDWRVLDPIVEACCSPTEEDLAGCFELGKKMAQAVKAT